MDGSQYFGEATLVSSHDREGSGGKKIVHREDVESNESEVITWDHVATGYNSLFQIVRSI